MPLIPPDAAVLERAQVVADRLPVDVDLERLLLGRAALLGLESQGRRSAGGTCRLLPTADGWVAVNLARPDDVDSVPAVVEVAVDGDPWSTLERHAADRPAGDVAARCQLLGVPAAELDDPAVDGADAVRAHVEGVPHPVAAPVVVDLTSMWAGPLCAHLLGRSGCRVVKVESSDRPDGARAGDPRFFEWLHAGHDQVTVDLRGAAGRAELRHLTEEADVVLESSRPRALGQLGIDAAALVAAHPGRTWVSITGYGRRGPLADRVAFGDDAAVAGGLVARDAGGDPEFCADAIADPLSGLAAAVAAFEALGAGGGRLVEVSMAAVARSMRPAP